MLSKVKQLTLVIEGDVQYVGFRNYIENLANKYDLAGFVYNDYNERNVKFVCEGEISKIERISEEISKYPGVKKISFSEKILLPKPVGRVVGGVEKDIFDRLDLGVDRLGSIDNKLGSINTHLASVDVKLGNVDTKLSSVDNHLASVDEQMKSMGMRLASVDEHLASVDARLDSVTTRLGSIDGTLKENTGLLKDIKDLLKIIAEK